MTSQTLMASILFVLAMVLGSMTVTEAFTPSPLFGRNSALSTPTGVTLEAVQTNQKGAGYVPKWKKKSTLAEEQGSIKDIGFENVGLKGTIPVVFKQGNDTRTSMAWAGQPLRDVASQAGQFIKYGCGKGECGTCECMVGGKWVRPCVATVPAMMAGQELVVQIKAVKSRSKSSGTFFSFRSFIMGFWNNLLGMIGFVKFRRAAKQNWDERKAYEDLVAQKTLEKKLRRAQAGGAI